MANKKINQLVSKTAILSTDIFGIGDATTGQLFKKTIAELQAAIGGAVISVNGLVGTVVLDTDDIQELATPTNKYFTDARARAAISLTVTGDSGASTYSSGTGVLNVPTYTLAGLGGITASFLSGTSGISYNSTTGVISYSGTVYTDASIRALLSGGTGISYNSSTGAISYSGTVYTDSSVRALISMTTTGTSGASTFNNTTGVINVPEYTLAGLGGISLTSLSGGTGITYNSSTGAISYSGTVYTDASVRALISASGAVSYNNTTGVISLTNGNLTEATSSVLTITGGTGAVIGGGTSIQVKQATTSVSGFLSSTDWTTFNTKQGTIFLTTTGTSGAATFTSNTLNIPQYAAALSGTTNYVAKFTSSSTIGNSTIQDTGTALTFGVASTFLGNITIDKSSPTLQLNAPSGTASEYRLSNGIGTTHWSIYSVTGGSNTQANWALYSAGKTGGAGSVIEVTPTGAATFSSSVTAGDIFSTDGTRTNFFGVGTGANVGYLGTTTNHALAFLTNNTERMRITSAGVLLINATSSTYGAANGYNLGVKGTSGQGFISIARTGQSLDSQGMIIGLDTATAYLFVFDNIPLSFTTNNTERGRITAGGNWLLGTSTDNGEKLYVSGAIRATSTITANSDIRIKSNITKIENALEKVGQISGYTYNTNYDDKRHGGVIAQEIDKVFPEIVNTGNDGLMGVEYGNISALLIEAIKEQQGQIKELKALLNK